ncbi:MAG: toll/interleukin-1 receptor domain-containing protein [Candidatus Thiodiazotropha sp. (ex Codakia rugifera)]|nr:toll/interleukin-1 receptor domain-containing protein [Candidatus Thiodiazotropha sp. (ex Codakia rugifera)]
MTEYALVPKIVPAFRRLQKHYENKEERELKQIIDNAKIHIDVATDYDNWNGGTYGHDVYIFIPNDLIGLVDLDHQDVIFQRIQQDLNKATPEVENEYIRAVFVQAADDSDPYYQASISFNHELQPVPQSTGLWKENYLRVFISHRDKHKSIAHELANSLEPFGISAFVAHDVIKPMKEWVKEILNGLTTMEVMLVLLTDDFHDSEWTNQEVGFALAKGIPIICVKTQSINPKGFIGSKQALKASYENITNAAPDIHKSLIIEIGQEGRLKSILIESFILSTSYIDAIERLEYLTKTTDSLSEKEFSRIVEGYEQNDQLYGCAGIHTRGNWFKRYLESATGKKLEFHNCKILDKSLDKADEIPF